ncbi:MAG: DUF120 domain-containing protein [Promethearchaeota archaeon]
MKLIYWFYLLEIAKAGGMYNSVSISTAGIGKKLNVSQQTASRRLSHLAEHGYIKRETGTNKIQAISLAPKGIKLLRKIFDELYIFFSEFPVNITLKGRVLEGIGEGKYYVSKYSSFFKENLGEEPFPGTLNVQLLDEEDAINRKKIEIQGGILMRGFSDETRSFGDVSAYPINISSENRQNFSIPAHFLKIKRTHYSDNILEIISSENLRESLSLKNGTIVYLEFTTRDRAPPVQANA